LWADNKAELDDLKTLNPETAENDRRELLQRFTEIVGKCSDGNLRKITTVEVRAEQQARVTLGQRQVIETARNTLQPDRPVIVPDLDKAITFAVEHCFQNESVIKDYELYEAVLQHAQGAGVDLDAMKALIASHPGLVIGLRGEVGATDHYKRELESALMIEEGKGKGLSISIAGLSERLSQPQHKAVKSLLESRDQFSALSGSSGVGKTEFVKLPP
jgi:hypothetical protein